MHFRFARAAEKSAGCSTTAKKTSFRPMLESVMKGEAYAIPEKFAAVINADLAKAKEHGVTKEAQLLLGRFLATKNDYAFNFIKRLGYAIDAGVLENENALKASVELMAEHPQAADSMLKFIANLKVSMGNARFACLGKNAIKAMTTKTLSRASNYCPEEMTETAQRLAVAGEFDDIKSISDYAAISAWEIPASDFAEALQLPGIESALGAVPSFDASSTSQVWQLRHNVNVLVAQMPSHMNISGKAPALEKTGEITVVRNEAAVAFDALGIPFELADNADSIDCDEKEKTKSCEKCKNKKHAKLQTAKETENARLKLKEPPAVLCSIKFAIIEKKVSIPQINPAGMAKKAKSLGKNIPKKRTGLRENKAQNEMPLKKRKPRVKEVWGKILREPPAVLSRKPRQKVLPKPPGLSKKKNFATVKPMLSVIAKKRTAARPQTKKAKEKGTKNLIAKVQAKAKRPKVRAGEKRLKITKNEKPRTLPKKPGIRQKKENPKKAKQKKGRKRGKNVALRLIPMFSRKMRRKR